MSGFPEDLFEVMASCEDDEAPDGAWQAILEDAVEFYNEENGTSFDSNDAFHAYIDWSNKK